MKDLDKMIADLERLERLHGALSSIPSTKTIILRERAPGIYTPVTRNPLQIARELAGVFKQLNTK